MQKILDRTFTWVALLVIVSLILPAQLAFAQAATTTPPGPDPAPVTEETSPALELEETATSTEEENISTETSDETTGTTTEETSAAGDTGETGTSTPPGDTSTSTPDQTDASSTPDGTAGGDGSTVEGDGENGSTPQNTGTSSDSCTEPSGGCPNTTPETGDASAPDGETGGSGDNGDAGTDGGGEPEDSDPVPVISETDFGYDPTPNDGTEVTGSQRETGRNTNIVTGIATAQAELTTDLNSVNAISEIEDPGQQDFDSYFFNASGTNEADILNTAATIALTGDNTAISSGPAKIVTGDAYSAVNIANVVNSNVVNSDGFIYLGNQILPPQTSLDLTDFFFPDPDSTLAQAATCTLLSCVSEDVFYTYNQENVATIINDATVEAVTGENLADGDIADIVTGDAYGGANVINVVNTNIVDSNYRLMTFNAMGDLDGDLLLPTQELFNAFYGRPNGMTRVESAEDIHLTASSTNLADVNNNIEANARSGFNESTTALDSKITTGRAESESNVLNKINQNIFGGDVMYLLVRVHGAWTGDVHGLPDGLDWMWTSDGVLIFNEGAEIVPSAFLPYDSDSYNADFENLNDVYIDNNVNIESITGDNETRGLVGSITTGEAVASANVMNVANTNVIGANWTYAVINIFGDFHGDIAFSEVDLELTGSVSGPDPLGFGDTLIYNYIVHNNSTVPATNVEVRQTLQNATVNGSAISQTQNVGTLAPGTSTSIQFSAIVDDDIPAGTTTVRAVAAVTSNEGEATISDNTVLLESDAWHEATSGNVPSCTLTANSTAVPHGEFVTLSWQTVAATGAELEAGGTTVMSGDNIASGTQDVLHTSGDTTYRLVVANEFGSGECEVFVETAQSGCGACGGGNSTTTASTTDDGGTGTTTDETSDDDSTSGGQETNNSNNSSSSGRSGGGGGGGPSKKKSLQDVDTEISDLDVDRTQIEVDPTEPPHIVIDKEASISDGGTVKAGEDVHYLITLTNYGGGAYDTTMHDVLTNSFGSVVSEQSWELGTILPGEVIKLDYVTTYSPNSPSGTYTNTASLEAYRYPDTKEDGGEPLKLSEAVHDINIDGVGLAVGNVEVIAYFPDKNGKKGALIAWETSKPAVSQIFYSREGYGLPYNKNLPNYGSENASLKLPEPKTRHAMILFGLDAGTTYNYRIHAEAGEYEALGGDYTFTIPAVVTSLTLAFPLFPTSQVAGAAVTTPTTPPAPNATPQPTNITPTVTTPVPKPEPKPAPAPAPQPEPEPKAEPGNNSGGFFKKAANKVLGIFR